MLKRPDGTPRKCIIDVVLSVNGLPVVTAELKNPLTGQRAEDACKQYMTDRDGRDPLFRFKERALVHFAVDPDEAWMTTELKGAETVFLPFNRGHNFGAGNPPVEGNWKTHYLWDEVLCADSLLDILQRFMHLEVTERTVDTPTGKRTVRQGGDDLPALSPARRGAEARRPRAGARAGAQLPDSALRRLGQIEQHRLARASAGDPARRS